MAILSLFPFPSQEEYLLVYRALHDYLGTISQNIYENVKKQKCMYQLTKSFFNEYVLNLYLRITNLYNDK